MKDEKAKIVPPWFWSVVPGEAWGRYHRMKRREGLNGSAGRIEQLRPDPRDVEPPSGFTD